MLDDLKYIHDHDPLDTLGAAEKRLGYSQWSPTVPTVKNLAKRLALDCIGKTIIIYSSLEIASVSDAWATDFTACAGQPAVSVQFPGRPDDTGHLAILLKTGSDLAEVRQWFTAIDDRLSTDRPGTIPIEAEGVTLTEQLRWLSALGDFVTIYAALLNGRKPLRKD
ncbi:MAG: hypothetical protein JWM81_675 [Candidatus Saccharibacteria bacterium]|nr:hypothetical protein [Candidatus Saccharibacteria bacterium]